MRRIKVLTSAKLLTSVTLLLAMLMVTACESDLVGVEGDRLAAKQQVVTKQQVTTATAMARGQGAETANGWYEGEEIYYLNLGFENAGERGENDIYLIGGDRVHQAQVVEFIPGEPGYSPHWNVHVVHAAGGATVQDILDAGYASQHYESEGVLFDDVADILAAEADGLVRIEVPGVVVLCPIVSEEAAEAPGNDPLPEDAFELLEPEDTF